MGFPVKLINKFWFHGSYVSWIYLQIFSGGKKSVVFSEKLYQNPKVWELSEKFWASSFGDIMLSGKYANNDQV